MAAGSFVVAEKLNVAQVTGNGLNVGVSDGNCLRKKENKVETSGGACYNFIL